MAVARHTGAGPVAEDCDRGFGRPALQQPVHADAVAEMLERQIAPAAVEQAGKVVEQRHAVCAVDVVVDAPV